LMADRREVLAVGGEELGIRGGRGATHASTVSSNHLTSNPFTPPHRALSRARRRLRAATLTPRGGLSNFGRCFSQGSQFSPVVAE
jgi:hypothetical protein